MNSDAIRSQQFANNSQLAGRAVERVVVAMSGGVDSSVAALLVARAGFPALGVSMQVWDYRQHGGCSSRATCCAPDDFTDARRVAGAVGIPYYVFDFEESFRREVINRFVDTYQRGRTPNPCVDCNAKVKFFELRERARALGCSHVATGHYARIEQHSDGWHLLRAVDREKDQSYFLYNLTQQELAQTLFPIGELTKPEVREIARQHALVTASKPESQDICFVSGSVQDFLVKLGTRTAPGTICDLSGRVIGAHDGVHQFTVGQRKGLGIGGSDSPLYVISIDAHTNTVTVGPKEALARSGFRVEECTFMAPQVLKQLAQLSSSSLTLSAVAQVRHRHPGLPVTMTLHRNGDTLSAEARWSAEWAPVSPGQACVFYDSANLEVLGGGRIV